MKNPVAVIGVGEIGSVFARGFLRLGHPVYPVTRDTPVGLVATALPAPELVLIAVAEADLQFILAQIPERWADRLCLLQNELLPRDWETFANPTVISVWFEKKKGMDYQVIVPSPVYGTGAQLVADALAGIDIPTRVLTDSDELLFELVVKNLYILTTNIAGLRVGGTVGELWRNRQHFAREVSEEVIDIQEAMTGQRFDRERLIQAMRQAFAADPDHKCMGRSAPARLQRAVHHGDQWDLPLPVLRKLLADTATSA